jgi:hypothetical protein
LPGDGVRAGEQSDLQALIHGARAPGISIVQF